MNRNLFKRSVIAASLVAVTAGGMAGFGSPVMAAVEAALPSTAVAKSVPGAAVATDFSGIVRNYGPAVVNISVVGKAEQHPARGGMGRQDPQDPFSGMFPFGPGGPFGPGSPFGPGGPGGPGGAQPAPEVRGLGSGFIVSPDGLILTNAHVVEGAEEVTVRLNDRREFKAKVLGADKQTDVAVLRIEAKDLPFVKIGDPNASNVGEPVLAIGSPFGLDNTATAGIISAKSRALPEDTYVPFLQTDVAVNPGNSGGPLFNMKGEVIGINSQIYSRTGGYQGLSFAIPMDVALHVQEQLVKHGKVTRGRLGVSVQGVTQGLADSLGLPSLNGALVASVEKGSPAAKGGLQPGDVIVRFGDQEIRESTQLPAQVARTQPGSQVQVEVLRNGKPQAVTVTVGQLQDASVAQNDAGGEQQGRLGLAVRPLEKQEQKSAGVEGGVLVENVTGPAARAGIEAGDIVLGFNGKPVTSVEQLRALVSKARGTAALLVQRDENRLFVPVELG
jgi:serine protease Do